MSTLEQKNQGVHKKFYILTRDDGTQVGVLHANDKEGIRDFKRETTLQARASNNLKEMISPQVQFEEIEGDLEECMRLLNEENHEKIAFCALYPQSFTLDEKLSQPELHISEGIFIIDAIMQLHIGCFKEGFTQRDNHANNILLIDNEDTFEAKFIDLGKARLGSKKYYTIDPEEEFTHSKDNDYLHDLKYLCLKKDHRFGDTLSRSIRSRTGYNQSKMAKHYPIHRLLDKLESSDKCKSSSYFQEQMKVILDQANSRVLSNSRYREQFANEMQDVWSTTLDMIEEILLEAQQQRGHPAMPFLELNDDDSSQSRSIEIEH